MIPALNHSGVLPPFLDNPDGPATRSAMAPYIGSMVDLAERFGRTPERKAIIAGMVAYRVRLKSLGITQGFQWVDGSFVEDVEKIKSRPPADVDFVTFAYRPSHVTTEIDWRTFVDANRVLFDRRESKKHFLSDAFFVDLNAAPHVVADNARYWFGLFSHQRDTYQWKGSLRIDLSDDENSLKGYFAA